VSKLRISAVLVVCCVAASLQAVTYVVPTDRDLVRRADAVVLATALESHAELNSRGAIVTVASLQIDDVLKGTFVRGASIALTEMGGMVGESATMIPGSPRYDDGKHYLVFLRRTADGWATWGMGLGKFEPISDLTGRELFTRGGAAGEGIFGWDESTSTPHVEQLRDAESFRTFVGTVVADPGAPAREDYVVDRNAVVLATFPQFVPKPDSFNALFTRPDYLLNGNFRWQTPTAAFDYCCSPFTVPGGLDGPTAISNATANWTGAGAGINYSRGSVNSGATAGFTHSDGINAVLFNDPNNEVPNGVAAIGGITKGVGTYMLADGFTYFNTVEVDVVVGKSFSTNQATFVGVMTHEIGHTLGFRHSNQQGDSSTPCGGSLPCSTNAIMNSIVAFNLSTLQQWDLDAAQTVYGTGPVCNSPSINVQPQDASIASGQSTMLSVGATGGSTPYTYHWFIGSTAGSGTPTGTNSSSLTVSPTTTTKYSVTVTSACGNAPAVSTVATVTVVPCTSPTINGHPQNATITSGQSTMLTVSANPNSGVQPFSYQWFTGNPPGTAIPGQTQSTITVSPTSTTIYYATVTSSCGAVPAQSNTATVTVNQPQCVPPSITLQPASQTTISSGQSVSLSLGYTGSLGTVTWYQGTVGSKNTPVGGGQNFTSAPLSSNTSFWAEIVNGCGSQQSTLASVTVQQGGGCTPISISLQPQSTTIASGTSTQLTVGFTGTPGTITWYQGAVGNRTTPVGSAQNFATPTLTATTTYWAELFNTCTPNGVQSDAAIVTVTQGTPCTAPSITTQPASVTTILGVPALTFTVAATGTSPLIYQWYRGAKGDTSKPVGTNSPSFTSGAITGNTSFWVRVSNTCNGTQSADSDAAVVTVSVARHRPVRH
jgi:hypothetical protein